MIDIDLVVLDRGSAGALGATIDIFDVANELHGPLFDLRVLSAEAGIRTRGGVEVAMKRLRHARPRRTVFVLGAGDARPTEIGVRLAGKEAASVARWLAAAHTGGATIAASCTGVFFLAKAGLLDGRLCTTTWWMVSELQRAFPACRADADAMVVEDRGIWTAGAAFAQIDLAFALLERLAGAKLAQAVARRLLVDRRSSQAPFIAAAELAQTNDLAQRVEAAVRCNLAKPQSLAALARGMGMSARTFDRRIHEATGLSPMRFVQKIRLSAALDLLRAGRLPLERIAGDVGFADPAALYRLIVRHTGQKPSRFRPGVNRV